MIPRRARLRPGPHAHALERHRTLLDLAAGELAEVRVLEAGPVAERLQALGIFAGSRLRLIKAAPFSGPLLVEDAASGARIMIARAMAAGVELRHDRSHGG